MEETFLGFGSAFWQFIYGLVSTIIIAIVLGIISSKWLNKRELLNAKEGELLNKRIDVYFELLDFLAALEEKVVVSDPELKIQKTLQNEFGLSFPIDRASVECWPMMTDFDSFNKMYELLDEFYQTNFSYLDKGAAKELIYVYGIFSRIYNYYIYLGTLNRNNERLLSDDEIKDLLSDFYRIIGIILDAELSVMQTRFEKKLVKGMYKFNNKSSKHFKNDEMRSKYFVKRYIFSTLCRNEPKLFILLVQRVCRLKGIDYDKEADIFKNNDIVVSY